MSAEPPATESWVENCGDEGGATFWVNMSFNPLPRWVRVMTDDVSAMTQPTSHRGADFRPRWPFFLFPCLAAPGLHLRECVCVWRGGGGLQVYWMEGTYSLIDPLISSLGAKRGGTAHNWKAHDGGDEASLQRNGENRRSDAKKKSNRWRM